MITLVGFLGRTLRGSNCLTITFSNRIWY